MPESITFDAGMKLPGRTYSALLLDALRRFLQSDDDEPMAKHMPRYGALGAIADAQFYAVCQQSLQHVKGIWDAMKHKGGNLPLGHDGYLKLWALSRPRAQIDYVMVDEAQDINSVLLGVLARLNCPVVYVGDPYQQIYDWRGAVNAMEQVESKHRVLLSRSFRFGDAIATAATIVLKTLGAKEPLRGSVSLSSHLTRVRPDAILTRSNAGVMGSVFTCLRRGVTCHVLGGTQELERVLRDAERVKQGSAGQSPELLGFSTWRDVMAFSGKPEGESLRSLVMMVQEYGEGTILRALAQCERDENNAQVVCSTAHRAKGREWDYVRVDPDFDSGFVRASKAPSLRSSRDQQTSFEAEARLLYVAMTRARRAVHLPVTVMHRFGLKSTTDKVLGNTAPKESQPEMIEVVPSAEKTSEVVSPYHSPRSGESKEMSELRRYLR